MCAVTVGSGYGNHCVVKTSNTSQKKQSTIAATTIIQTFICVPRSTSLTEGHPVPPKPYASSPQRGLKGPMFQIEALPKADVSEEMTRRLDTIGTAFPDARFHSNWPLARSEPYQQQGTRKHHGSSTVDGNRLCREQAACRRSSRREGVKVDR
jgi:hypothetical protein